MKTTTPTCRTVQGRGYCSKAGYALIDAVLRSLCDLYNGARDERIDAQRTARRKMEQHSRDCAA